MKYIFIFVLSSSKKNCDKKDDHFCQWSEQCSQVCAGGGLRMGSCPCRGQQPPPPPPPPLPPPPQVPRINLEVCLNPFSSKI